MKRNYLYGWAGLLAASVACTEAPADRAVISTVDSAAASAAPVVDSLTLPAIVIPSPIDSTSLLSATDSTPPLATATDSLSLTMPVEGVLPWELRDTFGDPRTGHAHEALDIMAPRDTHVLSAADGRLTKLHLSKLGGIMVYAADASDRYVLMYAHLDRYADGLTEGMPLRRGQVIGYVGSTGNVGAAGPHLHFAIARGQPSVAWWKGDAVNPYPLLFRPKR